MGVHVFGNMGNEPSNSNDTAKHDTIPVATVVPTYAASAPPAYQTVEPCMGSASMNTTKAPPPPPRKDIPASAIPIQFSPPTKDRYPKGILYQLGTEGGKSSYSNPNAARKCEVSSSNVETGILNAIVENCVGTFVTQDEPNTWLQVSLGITFQAYPEHYVIGGDETGHRDDMPQSWVLEASNDQLSWHLLREHTMDPSFTDADHYCGPKGWQCYPLPPTGPFRHFRIRHTGSTAAGSGALSFSGFELFGHLVIHESL